MRNITYRFEQVSPNYGIEDMKAELQEACQAAGDYTYHQESIFSMQSEEFAIHLFLDAATTEEEEPWLKVLVESVDLMGKVNGCPLETLDVADASMELNHEDVTLEEVKQYLFGCLEECYYRLSE